MKQRQKTVLDRMRHSRRLVAGQTVPQPPKGQVPAPKAPVRRDPRLGRRPRGTVDPEYVKRVRVTQAAQVRKQTALTGKDVRASDIERVLADELAGASAGTVDTQSISKLADKYLAMAEQVSAKYKKFVLAINAALDKGDAQKARSLYLSKEFRRYSQEYDRLMNKGALRKFFKTYGDIERIQEDWFKRQMQATLNSDRKGLEAQLRDAVKSGDREQAQQLRDLLRVYEGQTGYTDFDGPKGQETRRRRTIQEELAFRDALKRMEAGRLRAQFEAQQRQRRVLMMKEGLVEGLGGRALTREQKGVEDDMFLYVKDHYGGDVPNLKSSEDLTRFADELVAQWEARHPRPKVYTQRQGWLQQRAAYEREVHGYFGSVPPEWWDRVLAAPGISHLLAIFQGPVSSIGAGGRVLQKSLTGQSSAFIPELSKLPPDVKEKLHLGGPLAGAIDLFATLDPGAKSAQQGIILQWLQTPEGQRWYVEQYTEHAKRSQLEDQAFAGAFYDDKLSIGQRLAALNAYGPNISSSISQNLMFQLLADPLNAVPLKFTTYLSRARYAAEAPGGAFLGSSKFGKLRDFLAVDEGSLRLRTEVQKLLTQVGKDGKTARQLTDELLAEVAGIGQKSAREQAIRKKLIAAGIDKRLLNDTQLFNIVEQTIKDRLAAEGVDYASQTKKLREELKTEETARRAVEARRISQQQIRQRRLNEARNARVQEGTAARRRLAQGIQRERQAVASQIENAPRAERRATGRPAAPAESVRQQPSRTLEVPDSIAAEVDETIRRVQAETAANVSEREARLEHLGRMSEEEWWDDLLDRSHAILRSARASKASKDRARAVLADIESARYAKRAGRSGGTRTERAQHANRVVAQHGKDAEELIAPKQVAPYVEDAAGVTVEQSRVYYRTLRNAGDTIEGGARTLGPDRAEDFFPFDLWNKVEKEISDAIADYRGRHANTSTRMRGRTVGRDTEPVVGRLTDTDAAIVAIKRDILARYGISVEAYDEARKVLWKGHVGSIFARRFLRQAKSMAGDFKENFLKLRATEAKREGRRKLAQLAGGDMFGHTPDEVMEEFLARYSDDGQLAHTKQRLTAFQEKTLREHFKSLSGIRDIGDETRVGAWLRSRNAPDFKSRESTREFLKDIGAWSPRRADQFTAGARSWSIDEEAAYWRANYGHVPPWADRAQLSDEFEGIFHDQNLYGERMQAWGVFNRSAELRLRMSGSSAQEIEQKVISGDPVLGLKGKRELDLQRKYVVERYGDLVGRKTGEDAVELTAMPWLMYPDELRTYLKARQVDAIADDLIRSEDELDEVLGIINPAIDEFWAKYIGPRAAEGPVMYEDIFRMASEIQARLLADPKWARRYRDVFGDMVNAWATVNRALVFTNPSFAIVNAIDSPIKTAWYSWTRRGLFNPGLHGWAGDVVERAAALVPQDLGIDLETTIYRLKQRPVKDYALSPMHKGLAGVFERASAVPRGLYRASPALAGRVEVAAKMRLAQGMWPQVYTEALTRLKDPDLADAFARRFVKEEISRMWPTVGDGAFEKFFNSLVPFASYMVKNKVLFISEALAHPAIFNQIEFVGQAIEKMNYDTWREEHPGEFFDPKMARRIELPWAPGYFLDLGQFSDATRGLKPLYQGPSSIKDFVAQWVRIVNPGTQAGLYMLLNAMGVTQRVVWEPVYDEQGFVTGYERKVTGWTEPWSNKQPDFSSMFWLLEAAKDAGAAGELSLGEASQLFGKVFLFDAIAQADRGRGLNEYYMALRDKDPDAARSWLENTESGKFLQEWWRSKGPREVADLLSLALRKDKDPKPWLHAQTEAFQKKVREGYGRIEAIRSAYEAKFLAMTPGTNEYRDTKAEMLFYISEVYRLTPELLTYEVYSKSASDWSKQLAEWQTRMKMDEFFALNDQRPKRAAFDSSKAYTKALDAWQHQKEVFLKTYPDVEAALGTARNEFERVREAVEKEWDEVLGRIETRNRLIDAAKSRGDQEKADLLYLQNELDFSLLDRDYVAMYFTEDDFKALPKGILGPPTLRDGVLKTAKVLLDFDAVRLEKAKREGRLQQYLDDQYYAEGMKEVILKAKGGDPFGQFDPGRFVAELRKRPRLLGLYYAKNPGKQQKWERTDAYIKAIAPWGRAAAAGNWDLAERLWDQMPQWVKDRYYAKHPERRQRAAQTAAYMGWMQRWVKTFDSGDRGAGMKFFWNMPAWVRERYFAKHPEKRAKYEQNLRFGKQLADYFAMDKAGQAAYLKAHPDLKKFLFRNVSKEEQRRQAIIVGYQSLPKGDAWLRRTYREKYPEVFSAEAKGERKLRRVYDKLAEHPDMLPPFEEWVAAIWASYQEMLQHTGARPRPLEAEPRGAAVRRAKKGRSATETSRAS